MKKNKFFLKASALALSIIIFIPMLTSCQFGLTNKTVVGTVNGQDVYYDQVYYLVSNYIDSVERECNGDKALMQAKLDKLVKENIVTNYAILALCEKYGLQYSSIDKDDIKQEVDRFIETSCGGSKISYYDQLNENGFSKRYFEYLVGFEMLYAKLPAKYVENKLVESNESEIIKYINKNFVHVNHIAIFNDPGESKDVNLKKMQEAKAILDRGEKTMSQLIGKYSEDTSDLDASGYYFPRGIMNEKYESVAFSLDIKEHSDVFEAEAINNNGEKVSCYYILERYDMDQEYIKDNFYKLKNDYYNSVINKDMQEISATLSFEPNKNYNKLDLTSLYNTRSTLVIVVIVAVCIIVAAAITVIIILKNKHKKKNVSYIKKTNNTKLRKK